MFKKAYKDKNKAKVLKHLTLDNLKEYNDLQAELDTLETRLEEINLSGIVDKELNSIRTKNKEQYNSLITKYEGLLEGTNSIDDLQTAFNEITEKAILKAVANPTKINMNIVHAQQARQIMDLLVGFKLSPTLWKHISNESSLSAGRCQSPALKLIYDNQKNINSNEDVKIYNTIAKLEKG